MSEFAASRLEMPVWSGIHTGALLLFGVALPLAALGVELGMHLNARVFFDPIPTPFHVLIIAFVAAANVWCWSVVWRKRTVHMLWAARVNGVAIGVALLYSVLFLPLLPLGTIGLLYFGLGGLVWAPLCALIVALRLRVHLRRGAKEVDLTLRSWPGIVIALMLLIALDLPSSITQIAARMALGDRVETRARGLDLLRVVGSEKALLRMCYVRSGRATDMLSFLINLKRPIDILEARSLYYRVTGRSFNTEAAPVEVSGRGEFFMWNDFDQGTNTVGGRVTDLWLASSRLDGSVAADAALGYVEWTMVFRNSSPMQREARSQIALPPGAVVSRVTLWVNGEEREAAFAGRGKVRQAYEAVVTQRRDPVLVTSAGPDRISVQAFPVPPNGDMKVRIGMTVPLALTETHEGVLRLPYFHERNFDVRDDLRHAVWIESKSKLQSALVLTADGSGMFRADVDDAHLASNEAAIITSRPQQNEAWSPDTRATGKVVRQVISDDLVRRPRRLVIVVDGSRSMRDVAGEIAKNIEAIPTDVNIRLIFAHDEMERAAKTPSLSPADAAKQIASFRYVGGNDNTAALVRALDLIFEQPESVLLWIHGPQPERLETTESLLQRLERGPKAIRWYDLQVAPGPNFIAGSVDGLVSFDTLRTEDVSRVVSAWRTGNPLATVRRERIEADTKTLPASARTSDHLVRLWANDEVTRLIHTKGDHRDEALALAAQYQLVTPISGAVVLETQQQYDAAGLQPVPAGTVPSIPEPEEWALMIVALGALAFAYRRRHAFVTARPV
jgi:hypothetical protein